jgi:hypothetical protein
MRACSDNVSFLVGDDRADGRIRGAQRNTFVREVERRAELFLVLGRDRQIAK